MDDIQVSGLQKGIQISELHVYISFAAKGIRVTTLIPGRDLVELIGDAALFEFLTPPDQEKAEDSLSSGVLFWFLVFNHYIGSSERFLLKQFYLLQINIHN